MMFMKFITFFLLKRERWDTIMFMKFITVLLDKFSWKIIASFLFFSFEFFLFYMKLFERYVLVQSW